MKKSTISMAILFAIHGQVAQADGQVMSEVLVEGRGPVTSLPKVDDMYADTLQLLSPASSDTASLLKNIPGIEIQGGGGVSSIPVIHGMADDRLRIKVDGMDLISACANHMNPPLSYIDPTNVESARVFAGISPVSVGGDSIGGSIIVDSPEPEFVPAGEEALKQGEAGLTYRSNNDAFSSNLAASVATDQTVLSYRGAVTKGENYKAGDSFKTAGAAATDRGWLDGDEVGSTKYKAINHSFSLASKRESGLIELKVGVQDIPYQAWANQRMDMTGNDSTQVNLRYQERLESGDLEAQIYNEHTRHKMQFADDKRYYYSAASPAGMPMDTEGDNSGLSVKNTITLSDRDILRLGGEIQRYRLDDWWEATGTGGMSPNTFWNINDGERDRYAAFAEWEAKLDAEWTTQLGVRYERVSMDTGTVQGYNTGVTYATEAATFNAADRDKSDDNIDLTSLARLTLDDERTLEFGYARKTRSPNLYERFAWSTGGMAMRMVNMTGDGNGYVGNLELEPEVAHTLSGTFDWHDAKQQQWQLALTPYITYVDDYIDAERCSTTNCLNSNAANLTSTNSYVYLQYVNQSAKMAGIDVSGRVALMEGAEYGDVSATGLLNYVKGENETTGDNLYNIMPLNAKFALEQSKGDWVNIIELELVDDKSDVSSVRNELQTAGYGLLNLRSNYEWKQAQISFGVENLFDRFYNDPLGGAYVGQGATMSAEGRPGAVDWGTPVPGMGRSIYVGVKIPL